MSAEQTVEVSQELKLALGQVRVLLNRREPPVLERSSLSDIEEIIRTPVPSAVLAFYAALGKSLGDIPRMIEEMDAYYETVEGIPRAWQKTLNFDYVPFDAFGEDEPVFACWQKGSEKPDERIVLWNLVKGMTGNEVLKSTSLLHYCAYRWPTYVKSTAEDFNPRLVTPAEKKARTVEHKKFGKGTVVAELEGDKLTVDFGTHGIKTLMARFVHASS